MTRRDELVSDELVSYEERGLQMSWTVDPAGDWPCKLRRFRWRCTRWWYFWQWPSVLYARIRWRVVLKKLGESR